ncbi:MAG: sigma-70 family RNA polymerase sigma factor [Lachnospiraceae bacterium]|nr:sigma-70 family RNA polymerase sigma factor [Lachnospiraceae bacterium]
MITAKNFIQQLKKKNEKAIVYLIDEYGSLVKSIAKKHLYSLPNEIEDCVYEVFMSVWEHIDSYDESRSSFTNWIASITRYKAIDYLRKYRNSLSVSSLDSGDIKIYNKSDEVDLQLVGAEISEETEDMLSCLSEEDREILMKIYVDEEDVVNISSEYGIKPSTVYSRISRAKKKIKNNRKENSYEKDI